ncbi:MAG: cysteine dioxygenase family protein [Deltaproteobacteria bacterium]|nr:cysteine dioxygenase family protein [Deltaproteobacteria bacterium]
MAEAAQNESTSLADLFAYLDGLTEPARVIDLWDRIEHLEIGLDEVAEHVRFSPHHYLRNLVREGAHYHALVICWHSGQRSPIHNHAGSACGVKVISGVATETGFRATPSGLLKPSVTRDLAPGAACVSVDTDTHQVSNLQAPGRDLVTLHVYSPPLLRMDTYSLVDSRVGVFIPSSFNFSEGGGI